MARSVPSQNNITGTVAPWLSLLRAYWLWASVLTFGLIVFYAAPGGYAHTAHSLLHGLCAQTPSHTIALGERPLPFDARMTGIYGGFLVTIVVLIARGHLFRYGSPPRHVVVVLGALVAAMAVDGFNSLLKDLGIWHPYEPANALRVLTGYGTGIALAVALAWLLAASAWRMGTPSAGVSKVQDLLLPMGMMPVYGLLLATGWGWLHLPFASALVLSAWLTVSMLVLVMILLALRLDDTVHAFRQLHLPGATAALLALVVMIVLAGGRFWVEREFGISNAMM